MCNEYNPLRIESPYSCTVFAFLGSRVGQMVARRGFAANGNGASDSYQGTTSVVPTVMAGLKGFSP